jgi:hypothetical protein
MQLECVHAFLYSPCRNPCRRCQRPFCCVVLCCAACSCCQHSKSRPRTCSCSTGTQVGTQQDSVRHTLLSSFCTTCGVAINSMQPSAASCNALCCRAGPLKPSGRGPFCTPSINKPMLESQTNPKLDHRPNVCLQVEPSCQVQEAPQMPYGWTCTRLMLCQGSAA